MSIPANKGEVNNLNQNSKYIKMDQPSVDGTSHTIYSRLIDN